MTPASTPFPHRLRLLVAHPYLVVASVAFAGRVAVALATFSRSGYVVPDERQYVELARTVAAGKPASAWHPTYGQFLYTTTWPYTGVLRFLFDVVGTSRLVAQLYPAVAGTLVAVLTVVLARRLVSPGFAALAGLVVALLPSQVLWSSIALREAFVWLVLVALAVLTAVAMERGRREVVAALVAVAVLLLVLEHLRNQTLVAALWALAASWWLGSRERVARGAGALAVVALLPVVLGLGVAGLSYIRYGATDLNQRRTLLGAGADTSVAGAAAGPATSVAGGGDDGPTASGKNPEATRRPPVTVLPNGQRVVVDGSGATYVVDESTHATLRHLPAGLTAFLVRPYPWEATHKVGTTLARVENLAWLVLYALALWGAWLARRRPVIAFPVLVTGLVVAIAAVSQGNVGTAFRHRGQVLWALAVLAVVPLEHLASRPRSGRPARSAGRPAPGE